MSSLLTVENLTVTFPSDGKRVFAVRDASFDIEDGECLGLVGESGCGKSVTAFSLLNLVASPGRIEKGRVLYKGNDILSMTGPEVRKIRGSEISMIFQEPMISLNPVFTAGYQISENITEHIGCTKAEARTRAEELLALVGIPHGRDDSYPHEFSGGMRQRVMIEIALAASPSILIAHEPTTALDVTIQAQILDLLLGLQRERGMSLLLISHNLGVVANVADKIAIMYAGEIVETGTSEDIFNSPLHPYTRGLMDAVPRIGVKKDRLNTIPGMVPVLDREPSGCVFYPRCSMRKEECRHVPVQLQEKRPGHRVRCILA